MKKLKFILSIFLFALASCGYQFVGGGYINKDVTQAAVEIMENKSSETGAGIVFANDLIKEIMETSDTKIVDKAQADAVLKGRINSITFATLSRSTTESVVERRITANIDMRLLDKEGKIVWAVKGLTSQEEYKVSEDKLTDESNKRDAVEKISQRMAEKLVNRMLNNF
ncbi:MAG: hypothetical protein GY857_11470 [Desulfobacula sp.]|nr:hypothetical protein [Desulfobacula sp.]